jgi:mono/diheme cytochrome c family protein
MLALSDTAGVILLVLGIVFVVAAVVALVLRSRVTHEPAPDIPPSMEPGPSDPALETPLLQKLQGWGVVLVAFFVVWLPYNWLIEPSTNLEQEKALRTEAIERGRRSVELFSEENQLGVGCVRCHGPELRGGVIPFGTGWAYPPNLTTICGGPSTGHELIKSLTDIQDTIMQGRLNTAMPSWSIRYQGALDDQQINDIVNYLVFMSSKNVPEKDNICTNPDAVKAVNSPSASPSGTSGASGSTGATGDSGSTGATGATGATA